MTLFSYLVIGKELVYFDLLVFKQVFWGKVVDLTIWVVLTMFVIGYVMPYFGLNDFGLFQLGGVISAVGLFELYTMAVDLVSDFEGDRTINYRLTLPMPAWSAIVSKAVYYAIVYLMLTLCMIPVGKICLWYQFDLTQVHYGKLALALIAQSIFYACFTLLAASVIPNMHKLGSVWARFIFPMWFLGGFQFSWKALHAAVPLFAYIDLINPVIYITESTRSALQGQVEYLNFWFCLFAIIFFSALSLMLAIRILRKRLDFV